MPRRPKRNASKAKLQLLETEESSRSGTPDNQENENAAENNENDMPKTEKLKVTLKMFDDDVASEKMKILDSLKAMECEITGPITSTLLKMPQAVKEMKWGDYLKQKKEGLFAVSEEQAIVSTARSVRFLIQNNLGMNKKNQLEPLAESNYETPAHASIRSQVTSKGSVAVTRFAASTPAPSKRLPKPGEELVSVRGSPVALPSSRSSEVPATPSVVLPSGKTVKISSLKGASGLQQTMSPASLQQMKEVHKALGQMLKKK